MHVRSIYRLLGLIGFIGFLLMTGCVKTTPTRFYKLSSLQHAQPPSSSPQNKNLSVGVGPVTLADHLVRSQILIRSGANKIIISDFDKWAGSLSSDISRTLADNLAILLGTQKVVLYPWPRSLSVNFQLIIDITSFEADMDEQALLGVSWILFRNSEAEVLDMGKALFKTMTPSPGIEALVAALSQNLENFSRMITETILKQYQREVKKQ